MNFEQKVNMVTIGYFLAEEHWVKGITSEAINMLIKFLFEKANVNRIQAEVIPANNLPRECF